MGEPVNNEARSRFELELDGRTAVAEYSRRDDGTLVLTHTEVPPESEGEGAGGALARAALDWARAEGLRVRPACGFMRSYIRRHPEYSDLVLDG